MKTWLIVAAIIVAAVAAWGFSGNWDPGVVVDSAVVQQGEIREYIDERGKTRLPDDEVISMPFSGRIEKIAVNENQQVTADEVVVRMVPRDLELEVAAARAAVENLEAQIDTKQDMSIEQTALEQALNYVQSMDLTVEAAQKSVEAGQEKFVFATEHFRRMQQLFNQDPPKVTEESRDEAKVREVESRVDYEQDRLTHQALIAIQAATALVPTLVKQYMSRKKLEAASLAKQREEADARLQQALENQRQGTMEAGVDGIVLERMVTEAGYYAAGTELLRVGNLAQLEVEAEILTQDAVQIKPGNNVEIYGPAIGIQPALGKVREIYPAGFTKVSSLGVEQQRVLVLIDIEKSDLERLIKSRGLGVAYRVLVRIFTEQATGALIVPRSALFRSPQGNWQLYVIVDGQAQRKNVEVGLLNDLQAQITKGVEAGQRVILAPESNLENGAAVQIEEQASE